MTGTFDLARFDIAAAIRLRQAAPPGMERHMQATDPALISDEIVARIRGAAYAIAGELLQLVAAAGPETVDEPSSRAFASVVERLGEMLLGLNALREHLHALAIETKASERLADEAGIDAALSPLLAEQVHRGEPPEASMLIAAQVRFLHESHRMALAFADLPGDLQAMALAALRMIASHAGPGADAAARQAERDLRKAAPAQNRLNLLEQLADRVIAAGEPIDIARTGLALFLTQLARLGGERRDAVAMRLVPSQVTELAALLATAGLDEPAIAAQLDVLHPGVSMARRT